MMDEKKVILNLKNGTVHYNHCYTIKKSKNIELFYTFEEAKRCAESKGLLYKECSKCIQLF